MTKMSLRGAVREVVDAAGWAWTWFDVCLRAWRAGKRG